MKFLQPFVDAITGSWSRQTSDRRALRLTEVWRLEPQKAICSVNH